MSANTVLIILLSAGNFAIGMGAFVVIGILDPIAADLGIRTSQAGVLLTAYALAYAVSSPLCVVLAGNWSRRFVLLAGLGLFAVGALGSALAGNEGLLLGARVVAAVGAAMFTPVAAAVALSSGPADTQGRRLALVFFGLTLAQVVGVPVGSWLGYTFGWQVVFGVVLVLTLLVLLGVYYLVPRQIDFQASNLTTLVEALRDLPSVLSVLFTTTFLGAIYILLTYLQPLLSETLGFARNGVTAALTVFGIGAVLGNLLGGWLNDHVGPRRTLMSLCAMQIVLMGIFSTLPLPATLVFLLVLAWSVCAWSFLVPQQTRIVGQTPQRPAVVLALNGAASYLGAALGSTVGGWTIDAFGVGTLGVVAAAGALLALLHLLFSDAWLARDRGVVFTGATSRQKL